MADEVMAWLEGAATGPKLSRDRILLMLLEAAPARKNTGGYAMARNLERYGIEPDANLVDILDGWSDMLEAAAHKREHEEAARLGIEAPFGTSAAARFHAPNGEPVVGTAFRIPGDRLGRCAFVPDQGRIEEGSGELCVLLAGLEDVEILGPTARASDSLHLTALAAVEAHESREAMERMGRHADLDIGMFDADVAGMVALRETAGATHLSAHLELMSDLMESSQQAMDDGDAYRTWVAALLCAATARRVAMLAGDVPDVAAAVELVTNLSASIGEDEAGALLSQAPVSSITMH
jgi:hypothetical protein